MMMARVALPLVLALVAGAGLPAQQRPALRVAVEGVRLDVLVTAGGTPVPDLTVEQFRVTERGVPQQVVLQGTAETLSLAVVVDLSFSVRYQGRLQPLLAAAEALVSSWHPGDRAAILTVNSGVRVALPESGDPEAVGRTLRAIGAQDQASPAGRFPAWDTSSLTDAVLVAAGVAATGAGRAAVVLLSDGQDTASFLWQPSPSYAPSVQRRQREMFELLRGAGIVVDTLWLPRLLTMATYVGRMPADSVPDVVPPDIYSRGTRGVAIHAGDRNASAKLAERLAVLRAGYVLTYTPIRKAPCKPGTWQPVSVSLVGVRGQVVAPDGYRCR